MTKLRLGRKYASLGNAGGEQEKSSEIFLESYFTIVVCNIPAKQRFNLILITNKQLDKYKINNILQGNLDPQKKIFEIENKQTKREG